MLRFENASFFRVIGGPGEPGEPGEFGGGGNTVKIPSPSSKRVKYAVSLAAFRSIAITPFSFPFNNALRVREALKLQTLPYAAAGEMEIFPIAEKNHRTSSGAALYIPAGELNAQNSQSSQKISTAPSGLENRVWPAPLALVSRVGGEGLTFWLDEENICSMLWRNRVPVLYRWKPRAAGSLDDEFAWYGLYCKARGEEIGSVFALDAASAPELSGLPDVIKESLELCPWIGDVNVSRVALASTAVLERTVRSLSRAALWLLVMGLVVLAGNGLRCYQAGRNLSALRSRTAELYRSVFEPDRTEPVADPLGLARSAVAQLKGEFSDGRSISGMLSDLGAIFEENPDMSVTLETTRYNSEGADYTGSAPDMETVQEFRGAWAERAGSAQIGNLSAVPGGSGYRFDLYVRW